jgi:hypothetical protein
MKTSRFHVLYLACIYRYMLAGYFYGRKYEDILVRV